MTDEKHTSEISVVLVEDNEHDMFAFKRALQRSFQNFTLMHYFRAEDALQNKEEVLQAGLVVADHKLPGMSGIQFCENIVTEQNRPPLLLLTGEGTEEIAVSAIKMGVDEYLVKDPARGYLHLLPVIINEALKRHQLKTEKLKAEEELRISREQYRLLAESTSDIIMLLSKDGNILFVSPSVKKILGWNTEDLIEKSILHFSHPADKIKIQNFLSTVVSEKSDILFEWQCKSSNETFIWLENSMRCVYDSHHTEERLISVLRPITERKIMEEQLEVYTKQLKQLNSQKDLLFSVIAHDLRGPFTGLLGFSEYLSSSASSLSAKEVSTLSAKMHVNIKNIYRLLENLLHWSRLQTGHLSAAKENVEIYAIVMNELNLFEALISEKNITVHNTIDKTITLAADTELTSIVIRNLLSNAIKFTYPDGEIVLDAKQYGMYVAISIRDNGIGIEKQKLNSIFEFNPSNLNRGTKNEKGTGLGLSLCKEFITLQKGSIAVQSEPGKGTTFRISLPAFNNSKNK